MVCTSLGSLLRPLYRVQNYKPKFEFRTLFMTSITLSKCCLCVYCGQRSNMTEVRVAYSDTPPTLYEVHGRAKPVLCGPNSTESNLFHHGDTTYRGLDDCLNMLLLPWSYWTFACGAMMTSKQPQCSGQIRHQT